MSDPTVWVRARTAMSGERWFRAERDGPRREDPDPELVDLVNALDPAGVSVLLARHRTGFAVLARGLPTAQVRVNSPDPTAALAVVGPEPACRALAAALLAGLTQPPDRALAGRLGACVLDGADTVSVGLAPGLHELLAAAAPGDLPEVAGVAGELARTVRLLTDAGPLPAVEIPAVVTGAFDAGVLAGRQIAVRVDVRGTDGAARPERAMGEPEGAGPPSAAADESVAPPAARVLDDRPVRPSPLVATVVNVLAAIGVLFALGSLVVAARAGVDLAETGRATLGWERPREDRVDWYLLGVGALFAIVPLLVLGWIARVLRTRYRHRLHACFGAGARARKFSGRVGGDRADWLAEVLEAPRWRDIAAGWRAGGRLSAPQRRWSDEQYRQAADLVAAELNARLGRVALATGLAVAVAQRPIADGVAVVAGSAELQIEALASLGLRPTPRAWLHVGRAAATGLLAATYIDAEQRLEVRLTVRAAAAGLEGAGDLFEDADQALGELTEGLGGSAGAAVQLLTGATVGVTGTVLRQTAEFVKEVGDDIGEGVIVAAVLHFHAMSLVADALALDEAHRAMLAPTPGRVPRELLDVAADLARSQALAFGGMLRRRAKNSIKSAPRALWRGRDRSG